jgi:ATP/maltotriose-dependent transcriptional regulator MalT/DNA-binding SARP family transcriptional activator
MAPVTGLSQTAPRQRIPRPDVTRRVRGALERGPVLMLAEAGSGKTLALEEALGGWWTAAWVRCGETDRDPGHLMGSVLVAVRRAVPGAVDVLAERLTAGVGAVDPLPALRDLAAELESLLVEPLVVVLDDAERLHGSTGAVALVAELLGARSRLRVAVASRRELPLKMAKRQASGELTVLRSDDLAFTAQECARFLSLRLDREPLPEEVTSAMEATAGWPLGLELGAASGEPLLRGHASRRATFEYLAEEVLAGIEPRLREQVLESSVAPELSPPMIESLALPDDFVEQVQRSGLFLRRLEPASDAYTYHPLFLEFLRDRLRRSCPDARLWRLHGLVGAGLSAAGRPADSVDHWLRACEWPQAIAAMTRAGPELRRTSPATLRGWLDRLPPALRREPACRLMEGQLASNEGDYEHAIPLLREAVAARNAHDVEGDWAARWALSAVLFSTGDFEEMDRLADGWDDVEPDAAPLGALGTAFFRACGYAAAGRGEEAEALAERIAATRVGSLFAPALRTGARAVTETAAGRIDIAIERLEGAVAELDLADPTGMQLGTAATLALIQMDIGDYDGALRTWARTSAAARAFGVSWVARQAEFERALVFALQGRRVDAELALDRAGPHLGTGWRDLTLHKARAATAALRNDAGEALAAAERALALAGRSPTGFRVAAAVELAPVLEASGAGRRAGEVVDDVLAIVDRQFPGSHGSYLRARLLAARAWLQERDGHGRAAEDDVGRCFAEAGDAARHVLRREWPRLEPIVWRALERGLVEPATAIRELRAGLPGAAALVHLTRHPLPAVRQAAIGAATASGHPDAIRTVEQLSREDDPLLAATATDALKRLRDHPPPLSFTLLGGFSVMRGSWRADDAAWERRVAQRLVRFLLLHRDRPVSEDEILDAFWKDRDVESARRSLRVAVSRARSVLDVPGATSVIVVADRMYRLRLRAGDAVDVDEFEAAATAAWGERGSARVRLLERAAAAWGGEPLPEERYSDWSLGWSARLIDLRAAVLTALADSCLERGDLIGAGLRARELVGLDPLHEGGQRRLMVAYARAGQRSQALRQFLECRRALVEKLGVEPAAETARLHERILAGEPV